MNNAITVNNWFNAAEENTFVNFSATANYTIDDNLLLPKSILDKVLQHLEISNYISTITITEVNGLDEIWDIDDIVEEVEVLHDNLVTDNFAWGKVCIGYIKVKNLSLYSEKDSEFIFPIIRIPVFWTQNAAPIGLNVSTQYGPFFRSLTKGI